MKGLINFIADQKNAGKLAMLLYIALAISVIGDFFAHREHVSFFWDRIPGWSAVIGFVSGFLVIFVAGFLGNAWLRKKEDYYD